jgi:hypothetical protein
MLAHLSVFVAATLAHSGATARAMTFVLALLRAGLVIVAIIGPN